MKYNKNYHNNVFSAKLSETLDRERSIMDFDITLTKQGCDLKMILDHKKKSDKTSINTLRTISRFLNDNTLAFIVRNEINEETLEVLDNTTIVYEVKKYDNTMKNKEDFIANVFELRSDEEIKSFFSVETHLKFKSKLLQKKLVY